jgi:hypothetical protein
MKAADPNLIVYFHGKYMLRRNAQIKYLHSDKGLHAGVSSWRRIEDNAIPARENR